MPELPDVTVYVERLESMAGGHVLQRVRLVSSFVLRSVDPPLGAVAGQRLLGVSRIGKRIVLELEDELFVVIHLMVAGRLKWRKYGAGVPKKLGLAAFDFDHASVLFTEASPKKRASMHLVRGRAALGEFDRGGLEVMNASASEVREALVRENHTIKRALTDPTILSGIGNAYSDEILFRARLSPFKQTHKMSVEEHARVHGAILEVLSEWTERLREDAGDGFPEKVTAFREAMAVHGKYGAPCPRCGQKIQRIRYADNEANYCAQCQTAGRLLADRGLSRLLKQNWPKTLEELEERRKG